MDRGTFLIKPEYNCPKCCEAIVNYFSKINKRQCRLTSDGYESTETGRVFTGVLAGVVRSSYARGEIVDFSSIYIPEIEKVICCDTTIAVLAESGSKKFKIHPIEVRDA